VGKQTNTIEINGQRYDALTGKALDHDGKTKPPVDGIVSPKSHKIKHSPMATPKTVTPVDTKATRPVMDISRTPIKHVPAHKPEPAKTLMRRSVQKPSSKAKSHIKAHTPVSKSIPVIVKPTSKSVSPDRLAQAQSIPKSQLIKHFNIVKPQANHPHAVQAAKAHKTVSAPTHSPVISSISTPSDIFERALQQATAHEQPKAKASPKKRSRRGLRLASSALSVLLLTGFIAYQNMAAFNIRLASNKAGFAASLPGYKPSGFSVGKFTYNPGIVAINYHSNSDDRRFAITQKVSDWNSQTLREAFVATKAGDTYQTVQTAGQTIYLYGKKNATWVNKGVWYQVETNGSLSTHQLIELAASM
jgi:hypothetical protein